MWSNFRNNHYENLEKVVPNGEEVQEEENDEFVEIIMERVQLVQEEEEVDEK